MIPQLKKVERQRPAAKRPEATLVSELSRLIQDGPVDHQRIAAVTARHIIRRLQLADDTNTWRVLRDVVAEALRVTSAQV